MSGDAGAIALAEKVLAVLELGSFAATYKYALFTAILDLCLEKTSANGTPPTVLTTPEIAEKVIGLYWPHAVAFEGGPVLRQGGVRGGSQAEIVRAIESFRRRHAGGAGDSLHRARSANPLGWSRLARTVEWKLIEMPIPRLQVTGREEDRFLYEYCWGQDVKQGVVSSYQRGERDTFDNRLLLRPGVPEGLLRLNGILRPILRREWSVMVAGMNGLPESRLEEFLFGVDRTSLAAVRGPLHDLQRGRCFYCASTLGRAAEVDHFIPWARYADNGLDNLVVAHEGCNHRKRDFLAAADHVERWSARNVNSAGDLAAIAAEVVWEREPHRSRAVAVAMYSRMADGAKVWREGTGLVGLEKPRVERALAGWL